MKVSGSVRRIEEGARSGGGAELLTWKEAIGLQVHAVFPSHFCDVVAREERGVQGKELLRR